MSLNKPIRYAKVPLRKVLKRVSRRRQKRGYYWDGIQFVSTGIATAGAVFVLVDTVAQEFMPATCVRIRGHVTVGHWGSASMTAKGQVFMKIMYVEVNDAQAMTGDHSGQDSHEEDIAQRQLWTYSELFPEAIGEVGQGLSSQIEIDVKSKIRLEPHGKKLLVLIVDAVAVNHIVISGYVRALLQHG